MVQIENEVCRVSVLEQGCELCGFYDKARDREFLWQAGAAWKRHAPVLFPAIGGFAEGEFLVNGTRYALPPHGFARDLAFTPVKSTENEIIMELTSNSETRKMYPFDFCFQISHKLEGRRLTITWTVRNTGDQPMYFSIGAHPAFCLAPGASLAEHRLVPEPSIPLQTHRVCGRLVSRDTEPVPTQDGALTLSPDVLRQDALVFEQNLDALTLECPAADYRLRVSFPGFPVVAVWSPPAALDAAEFLCIEPWCGLNDFDGDAPQELSQKHLVQSAAAGAVWERSYSIEIL